MDRIYFNIYDIELSSVHGQIVLIAGNAALRSIEAVASDACLPYRWTQPSADYSGTVVTAPTRQSLMVLQTYVCNNMGTQTFSVLSPQSGYIGQRTVFARGRATRSSRSQRTWLLVCSTSSNPYTLQLVYIPDPPGRSPIRAGVTGNRRSETEHRYEKRSARPV